MRVLLFGLAALVIVGCGSGPAVVIDRGTARHLEGSGLGIAPRAIGARPAVSEEWALAAATEIARLNQLTVGPMVTQLGMIGGEGNPRFDWDTTIPRLAWIVSWTIDDIAVLVVLDASTGESLFVTADRPKGDRWYR